MKKIIAYTVLALGVLAISTSAIFVRLADAPSAITAFYRLFITTLILLPVVLFSREKRQELKELTGKQWILSIIAGILLGVHYILWFESLNYTSVASSTVLVTLQPLFTILYAYIFLHEKQSIAGLAGCAIALSGSFLISYGDFQLGAEAFAGDMMALLAAAIISFYFFIGQFIRKNTSATVYSVLGFGSSSLFLAVYALINDQSFFNYSDKTWLSFIGIALIATVFGQFILNLLLRWLPATSISMSILGEPVGTCILAFFILNESINLRQGAGMLIILCGLGLYFLSLSSGKLKKSQF